MFMSPTHTGRELYKMYTPGARNLRSHLRISTRTPTLKDLFQEGKTMYFQIAMIRNSAPLLIYPSYIFK